MFVGDLISILGLEALVGCNGQADTIWCSVSIGGEVDRFPALPRTNDPSKLLAVLALKSRENSLSQRLRIRHAPDAVLRSGVQLALRRIRFTIGIVGTVRVNRDIDMINRLVVVMVEHC